MLASLYLIIFSIFSFAQTPSVPLTADWSPTTQKRFLQFQSGERQLAPELNNSWIDNQLPTNTNFPPCPANVIAQFDKKEVANFLESAVVAETSALIVIKDGCTVIEKHFGNAFDTSYSIQSVTKSVGSIAIGTLLDDQKLLDLEQTLDSILPQFKDKDVKSKITLRNILTHTSGFGDWDSYTGGKDVNLVEGIANSPLKISPNQGWNYSSMSTYLLGDIIAQLAGKPTDQYLQERIFAPLNIQSAHFRYGVDMGGGLYMTIRDMILLGNMMLENGQTKSGSVLSMDWIEASIQSSQKLFPDYGLLWWLYLPEENHVNHKIYSAVGYQGQYIMVVPTENLLVIRTHQVVPSSDSAYLTKVYWEDLPYLIPPMIQ